jgi:hypothetical protein
MAARPLRDALGTARQAVISGQTQVKVAGPVYHGCPTVTSAIDALAHLITGSPYYFHAQGTLGASGEPNFEPGPVGTGGLNGCPTVPRTYNNLLTDNHAAISRSGQVK